MDHGRDWAVPQSTWAPLSLAPAQATSSSSWSKDEIQGLPFGSCHVGVPEIHHEDRPWAIVSGAWGEEHRGQGGEEEHRGSGWGGGA